MFWSRFIELGNDLWRSGKRNRYIRIRSKYIWIEIRSLNKKNYFDTKTNSVKFYSFHVCQPEIFLIRTNFAIFVVLSFNTTNLFCYWTKSYLWLSQQLQIALHSNGFKTIFYWLKWPHIKGHLMVMFNNLNILLRYVWSLQPRNSIIPSSACFFTSIATESYSCSRTASWRIFCGSRVEPSGFWKSLKFL